MPVFGKQCGGKADADQAITKHKLFISDICKVNHKMATSEDWWGLLVFVFFIFAIALFIIKILIEYPGLLDFKLTYGDSTENLVEYTDLSDIELDDVTTDILKERDKEKVVHKKTWDKTIVENISEEEEPEEVVLYNIDEEKNQILVNVCEMK